MRPHRLWYGLAAVPLVAGVVMGLLLVFVFVRHLTGDLVRFSTERPVEGELPAGAERTIYVRTADDSSASTFGISCEVVGVASGRRVPTSDSFGLTLTVNGESFVGLERFRVEEAGRYRVSCGGSEPARLAVGPRIKVFREVGRMFAAIIALMGGLGLAAVVVTIVAARRHQHRRRLQGLP